METLEIINAVCSGLGISLDFVLMFLIFNTRKTITKINIIILNYSLADLLGHIVLLTSYSKQFITENSICTLNSLKTLQQLSCILLLLILAFDCILELKIKDFLLLLGLIWALSCFVSVLSCILCRLYGNSHPINGVIATVYVTSTALIIGRRIYNCMNASNNSRADIVLIYLFLTYLDVVEMMGFPKTVFGVIEWFLEPLQFVFVGVFCVYLFFADKYVREFCLKCPKCSLRKSESVANFAGSDSDFDKYSVDLSYSRANEEIRV